MVSVIWSLVKCSIIMHHTGMIQYIRPIVKVMLIISTFNFSSFRITLNAMYTQRQGPTHGLMGAVLILTATLEMINCLSPHSPPLMSLQGC